MMYATEINKINELFIQGLRNPTDILRDVPGYKLICARTDFAEHFCNCPAFQIRRYPIPGTIPRDVIFIDVSRVPVSDIPYLTSVEGFYFRNMNPFQVIPVDLTAVRAPEPTFDQVANFFENYRKTMGDLLEKDILLYERQKLILTYYAAFAMCYINFDFDKSTFIKVQGHMKSRTNKGCSEDNLLFEKMVELIDTKYAFLDMDMILLNFERGIQGGNDVESNTTQET